ncbi:non-ribosomal peptide synthetase [Paenibacillus elgii]|uniref:non-ribosomal peptide synthetase n=1 Tax=Paenibacillus elgii TaxID=189691 RepID=UPI000FD6A544|nr:non-ribosomal peptide synthetase [Paenibacillus elgii]NEN81345.1 amino acid adenylation domain-containing protein [Paenibacillus elgii]
MSNESASPSGGNLSDAKRALLEKWKKGSATAGKMGPRERRGPLPLSFAQRRIWFLEQLVPGTPVYNIPGAVRLSGELNTDALKLALSEIIRRHEVFRTRFTVREAIPYQEIEELGACELPVEDLSRLPEAEREAEAARLLSEEARTPFDLTCSRLLRARLIRLWENDHLLVICMHHIISDGWSLGVFQREFALLYEAYSQGQPSPLPELPIQYGDFSEWQRKRMEAGEYEEQLAYWRRQLAGLRSDGALPYDRTRSAVPTYRGERHYFELSEAQTEGLRHLAQNEGATLYMALLSVLKVLLYRYGQSPDISVGCPIANRNQAQIEGLIGFFVNTLVMRSQLGEDDDFPAVLRQVKRVALEAYDRQDVPFERLVEALQPDRDLSVSSPFFQTGFVFQNTPFPKTQLNGLELAPITVHNGMAPFDLLLSLTESEGKLIGFFEYSTELFDAETVVRMTSHFQVLTDSILSNARLPVKRLALLPEEERRRVLTWGAAAKSPQPVTSCIHERFEQAAALTPKAVAVTYEGRSLTYAELDGRANALARRLRRLGVEAEVRVGIYLERSLELVVAILAVLKAGGAYVPLDPAYPKQRIAYIAGDAGLSLMLTQASLLDTLPDLDAPTIAVDDFDADAESQAPLELGTDPAQLAYVIYTSGSTGQPKGVLVEHRNVVRLFDETHAWFGFDRSDVWTLFHSHAFDFSVWEIWGALFYGGKLVVVPYLVSRSPESFHALLHSEGVTVLCQTPSAFRQLAQHEERQPTKMLEALRYVVFGGEALEMHTLKGWFDRHGDARPQLVNMYGITETTVHVTYRPLTLTDLEVRSSPIGIPIPDLSLYLLDRNLEPVPIGIAGEMYVGGAGVSRGYLNRPELTAERFVPDPFSGVSDATLYKTGDEARFLPSGELEFLGRNDHQVKIRGFRIELGEIEAALKQHAAVRDAVVAVKQDAMGHPQLVAYLIEKEADGHDVEITKQWEHVFDQTYENGADAEAADFNIAGWNSLYDGRPLPAEDMREWVGATVKHLLDAKPKRVLELGCGTGLLLFRVAPACEHYMGTDISLTAIRRLETLTEKLPQVSLRQQPAHHTEGIEPGSYDLVILNSVIQYFPSVEYFLEVLNAAVRAVRPGGTVFIGDVRSLPLQEAFYGSVEQFKARRALTPEERSSRVKERMEREHELLLDPQLFVKLAESKPQFAHAEIQWKRGSRCNELTRFRYDVLLRVSASEQRTVEPLLLPWTSVRDAESALQKLAGQDAEAVAIRGVPNARLRGFLEEVGEDAVDPMAFVELERSLPYDIAIHWAGPGREDRFDVICTRRDLSPDKRIVQTGSGKSKGSEEWGAYANRPVKLAAPGGLSPELRSLLKERLPDYFIPSACVTVRTFPLTSNGKIDRAALPAPGRERPELENPYVEPRTLLERRLAELWSSVLGIPQIGVLDSFFELGGHSLLATQLIFKLRDELSIEIPLRVLFETPTIEWMSAAVEAIQSGQGELVASRLDLWSESSLPFDIRDPGTAGQASRPVQNILLTGATGFLGAFLLRELLRSTAADIFCLVRGRNEEEAMRRLQPNLAKYGIRDEAVSERVRVIPGDLGQERLGLSEAAFERLAGQMDALYHNGSMVHFIAPYVEHKAANVLGTREMIRLANTGRFKTLHFVSTTHVFSGRDIKDGVLLEKDLPQHPEDLRLGYTQSKWVAERMVLEAACSGLPALIYRPGRIWGDSVTGRCQSSDFMWLIIKASLQLGLIPAMEAELEIVPADFAARAIVHLSGAEMPDGRAYHLVNPTRTTWSEVIESLADYGYALRTVPYGIWHERILQAAAESGDQAAKAVLPLLEGDWGDGMSEFQVVYDCTHLHQGLKGSGVTCPKLDRSLMSTYLTYFVQTGFLPQPSSGKTGHQGA